MIQCCGQHMRRLAVRTYATQSQPGPRVALVQGASRGLGLEFVRQLLLRPEQTVVATCRRPDTAEQLQQLQAEHRERLHIVPLDCTAETSIEAAASQVSQLVPNLDLLINVAAVLHGKRLTPETALSRVTQANLMTSFQTNTFGPILVSKAFAPLLVNAAKQTGANAERPAVIANMSARVGSVGDNRLGGWYSYRSSKTALNQLTKCMSLEFERKRQAVSCILLHPGTVDTDLSKPFQKNVAPEKLFDRERAIRQLLGIIDRTTMKETGRYYAWDGQEIPW